MADIPHPDHVDWAGVRDALVQRMIPGLLKHWGFTLNDYQEDVLLPKPPYKIEELKFIQLAGAKRIGKSMINGIRIAPYIFLPGAKIRLYAPEYELAQREMEWLDKLLFTGERPLCEKFPWLRNALVTKRVNPGPGAGNLEMSWNVNGLKTSVIARSWERRNSWVGEAIDLAVICEPGLLPDISAFTRYIHPNLADRNGICYAAGTPDNPWMRDIHDMAHDPVKRPDILCRCQIKRSDNVQGHVWTQVDEDRSNPAKGGTDTMRDFAINWMGSWDNYAAVAYEKWDGSHIKVVPDKIWQKAKRVPAGWDMWVALDTGRYCAMGQFISNAQGHVVMIDEWSNYGYQAGQMRMTDDRGFAPWFKDAMTELMAYTSHQPMVVVDPSSQFKAEINNAGFGEFNAVNDHAVGVGVANEYLAAKRVTIMRPRSRGPFHVEREVPRVMWSQTVTGVGGKHRLAKGKDDDHCADMFRYGLSWRPRASTYIPTRKKTIVEKDIEWQMEGSRGKEDDGWGVDTLEDSVESDFAVRYMDDH